MQVQIWFPASFCCVSRPVVGFLRLHRKSGESSSLSWITSDGRVSPCRLAFMCLAAKWWHEDRQRALSSLENSKSGAKSSSSWHYSAWHVNHLLVIHSCIPWWMPCLATWAHSPELSKVPCKCSQIWQRKRCRDSYSLKKAPKEQGRLMKLCRTRSC